MSSGYKNDAVIRRGLRARLETVAQPSFKQAKKVRAAKLYENPTEMTGLYDIVVRGKRDIRRLNDAKSLAGAQCFVNKHPNRGYSDAESRDLDGDGIPEIYVKKGTDFILINGYTKAKSDWARQYNYHGINDDKDKRKANPLNQWTRDAMELEFSGDDAQLVTGSKNPAWNVLAAAQGYRTHRIPKHISTYSIFCREIVKPIWDLWIRTEDVRRLHNFNTVKRSFLKVCGMLWNICVFLPTVRASFDEELYNEVSTENWQTYSPDIVKTIKANATFKELSWTAVKEVVAKVQDRDQETYDTLTGLIDDAIGHILETVRAKALED